MKVHPGGKFFLAGRGDHGGLAIPFIGIDSVINVKPEAEGEEERGAWGDSGSGQLPIAQILPLSTFRRPRIPRNRTRAHPRLVTTKKRGGVGFKTGFQGGRREGVLMVEGGGVGTMYKNGACGQGGKAGRHKL